MEIIYQPTNCRSRNYYRNDLHSNEYYISSRENKKPTGSWSLFLFVINPWTEKSMTAGVSFRFGAGGYVDLPPGILKARLFGPCLLGGSVGMLPLTNLKFSSDRDAFSCILEQKLTCFKCQLGHYFFPW